MEMYADDVSFEDFALDQRVEGKSPARDFFAAFMNPAERKNTFTLVDYSGDDRGGAVEWIWKAEHQAEFMGLPARGKDTVWPRTSRLAETSQVCTGAPTAPTRCGSARRLR